ncbi:MAG: anti-sigma factor domain-containing protein [Planctomycetota bacterium]|jgi:anti-sigma-K factor RskA
MTIANTANPERLHDLLADRATQGLSPREEAELERLLAEAGDVDPLSYDWAAAALDVAFTMAEQEPMPQTLQQQVEGGAAAWFAKSRGIRLTGVDDTRSVKAPPPPMASSSLSLAWLPWLVAAACLALTLTVVWPEPRPTPPGLEAQLTTLVGTPGTTTLPWQGRQGVAGEVIWNQTQQKGFLRLTNLTPNDPKLMQYQLWIFDAGREARGEERIAVDGGVFDVSGTGTLIVPIDAKIQVLEPKLFAITSEPPGGVVEHKTRDAYKILLTAPVS